MDVKEIFMRSVHKGKVLQKKRESITQDQKALLTVIAIVFRDNKYTIRVSEVLYPGDDFF